MMQLMEERQQHGVAIAEYKQVHLKLDTCYTIRSMSLQCQQMGCRFTATAISTIGRRPPEAERRAKPRIIGS